LFDILKEIILCVNKSNPVKNFHIRIYIGYPILTFASKYLVKYKRYEKMIPIKVLLFRGGHKMIPLV